jgi:hypothetical protein
MLWRTNCTALSASSLKTLAGLSISSSEKQGSRAASFDLELSLEAKGRSDASTDADTDAKLKCGGTPWASTYETHSVLDHKGLSRRA